MYRRAADTRIEVGNIYPRRRDHLQQYPRFPSEFEATAMTNSTERDAAEDGSSSRNSAHESLLKDGSIIAPATLVLWNVSKMFGLVVDIVMICAACLFIVYGFAVIASEGTPLEHSNTKFLQRCSTLVSKHSPCSSRGLSNSYVDRAPQSILSCLQRSPAKL